MCYLKYITGQYDSYFHLPLPFLYGCFLYASFINCQIVVAIFWLDACWPGVLCIICQFFTWCTGWAEIILPWHLWSDSILFHFLPPLCLPVKVSNWNSRHSRSSVQLIPAVTAIQGACPSETARTMFNMRNHFNSSQNSIDPCMFAKFRDR